jgi:hypothetical protein
VASIVASRVALPSVAGVSPTLESLLPVQFQDLFKVDSEMLRPSVEVDMVLWECLGSIMIRVLVPKLERIGHLSASACSESS